MSAGEARAPTRRVDRVGLRIGLLVAPALCLLGVLFRGRVVIQARAVRSLPFTVGIRAPAPAVWAVGDVVQFRTRDLAPYYPAGLQFAKRVAAFPGDHLVRLGRDFYRNGRYLTTARDRDSHDRPAPLFSPPLRELPLSRDPASEPGPASCRPVTAPVIPEGTLFVLGTHERSFDSRYFGYVTAEEIVGHVVPLW